MTFSIQHEILQSKVDHSIVWSKKKLNNLLFIQFVIWSTNSTVWRRNPLLKIARSVIRPIWTKFKGECVCWVSLEHGQGKMLKEGEWQYLLQGGIIFLLCGNLWDVPDILPEIALMKNDKRDQSSAMIEAALLWEPYWGSIIKVNSLQGQLIILVESPQ